MDEVVAVGAPSHLVQVGRCERPSTGGSLACGITMTHDSVPRCSTTALGELPFQITRILEQHVIEKFSSHLCHARLRKPRNQSSGRSGTCWPLQARVRATLHAAQVAD